MENEIFHEYETKICNRNWMKNETANRNEKNGKGNKIV